MTKAFTFSYLILCSVSVLAQCYTNAPVVYTNQFNPGQLPPGWSQGPGQRQWTPRLGATPSQGTGPSDDQDQEGYYLYCETSAPSIATDTYIVVTDCIQTSALLSPTLEFGLHAYGADIGRLDVEQSDGLGGWNTIYTHSGELGDFWSHVSIPLTPFANQVVFRFVYTHGGGFRGDIAIDNIAIQEPSSLEWETNDSECAFDFNGVANVNPAHGPKALSSHCSSDLNTLNFSSSNLGMPWDLLVNRDDSSLPLSVTGLETPNGQIVNTQLTPTTSFLNGLTFATPFPGDFGLQVPGAFLTPLTSAQAIVLSPSHPDGFALSQACELHLESVAATVPNGPTTEDGFAEVQLCRPFAFHSISYTRVFVHSNGYLSFGSPVLGAAGWTGTPSNARSNPPMAGIYTDLTFSGQSRITISAVGSNLLSVFWNSMQYFGPNASSSDNDFTVAIDLSNGSIVMAGLDSLDVKKLPLGPTAPSDNTFIGISRGELIATDPGPTDFTLGSGMSSQASDMIYDNWSGAISGSGRPPSISAGVGVLNFWPLGAGYQWTSQ